MDAPAASMADATVRGLQELKIDIPGVRGRPVERMSGGQRQLVAIARAALWGGKLLLLDEPTAALGVRESREVLELIGRLSARGLTIVMVTHNLKHFWQVCTRVVVMRRGRKVADMRSKETTMDEVVAYITGAKEPGKALDVAAAWVSATESVSSAAHTDSIAPMIASPPSPIQASGEIPATPTWPDDPANRARLYRLGAPCWRVSVRQARAAIAV
jgi:ABC-type sugar transport system ATPase subunit